MTSWKLEDAKHQLSRLFAAVRNGTPQRVTRRGTDAVILVREEDWQRLTQRATRPGTSMLDTLRRSPLADISLDLERAADTGRGVPVINPWSGSA